jgi:predicted RNase H-like HicB family nuclease
MIDLYKIEAFWDKEAQVWVAESTDIFGLATEADTLEQLTEKLRRIIPELLIANHVIPTNEKKAINFELITYRKELIQVA